MSSQVLNRLLEWLAERGGVIRARISMHDRDRFNAHAGRVSADLSDAGAEVAIAGSAWRISAEAAPVPGENDAFGIEVSFKCLSGVLHGAAVAVDIGFSGWSAGNYVLMPAAAYDGNRFPSRRIPYSPKLWFPYDIGPDKPIIVTDIPKLNEADGPSRIQERSGSMALPCIGFRTTGGRGFFLVTGQGNHLGDFGIGIEETRGRDKAVLTITSPLVREIHSYRMCDMRAPSLDEPADFIAGDEVVLRFRVHGFDAPAVQNLFDKYAEIRKPDADSGTKCVLPFSACLALQEEKFNRDNFVPEHGYYSVGFRQNFLQDWQIGWTGGMISTYPLFFAGSARTRANVLRNFDWLFPDGISPSGFFWDCGRGGTEWLGGDIRKPHTGNWHLIRKSADAVFFIIKQFLLMEKLGIPMKPAWHDGTRRVCDSFVALWKANGQFGQFVDSLTGEIRVGGSTSAAHAPAALSLAADYFADDSYRAVAEEAAEHFYQKFTRAGLACGGPGDALQNPDSESAYALVESYIALHDATGDLMWLARAGEAARQFSSWVVSYDFVFPPESMFAKAGIKTTGSVYANTQNKHSAPGICTMSGLGLLKIFRASGDRFALDLLRDIARGLPQYLPHPLKPLGDAVHGHMCERVNMTDWEGADRIGETLRMSTWAETSLMLTAIEIPGVYVRTDTALVVAFDHVETKVLSDGPECLVVEITNPTPAAAAVRVFAETSAEAMLPLAENALFDCRVLHLSPGEAGVLEFPKARPT